MTRLSPLLVLLLAVAPHVAGCGGDENCGGDRPSISACTLGLLRADCGGTGEPTFACGQDECRWFASRCIAREFRATDCPTTEACCHAVEGGTWPFADDWPASRTGMVESIAVAGGMVITDTSPVPIGVTVDPDVPATSPTRVDCEFPAGDHDWCGTRGYRVHATAPGAIALAIRGASLQPEVVEVEIVSVGDGLGARTFVTRQTDVNIPGRATCEAARSPHPQPLVTGQLVVSTGDFSTPSAVHGRGQLQLAEGTVDIAF